jgi:hypothetical protein
MAIGRLAPLGCWSMAVLMLSAMATTASAQTHDGHATAAQHRPGPRAGALVKAVREATEPYIDVEAAKRAGYGLLFGCVSGGDCLVLAADGTPSTRGSCRSSWDNSSTCARAPRFGLPAFHTLHVWAWKDNLGGTFGNWNPAVSCDAFTPPTPPAGE